MGLLYLYYTKTKAEGHNVASAMYNIYIECRVIQEEIFNV